MESSIWLFLFVGGAGLVFGALLAANILAVHRFFDTDEFWAGLERGLRRGGKK